jgi:hypothetical protein
MAPSLQEELAKRQIAARKVTSLATFPDGNEPWPLGVLFCSDEPFSRMVLGYLVGRRRQGAPRPIAWVTNDAISIGDFWSGKTDLVRSTAVPALTRAISYRIRKQRARP